jgi:hypothetical protein
VVVVSGGLVVHSTYSLSDRKACRRTTAPGPLPWLFFLFFAALQPNKRCPRSSNNNTKKAQYAVLFWETRQGNEATYSLQYYC